MGGQYDMDVVVRQPMVEQQTGAERQVRRFRASRGTTVQSGTVPPSIQDGLVDFRQFQLGEDV